MGFLSAYSGTERVQLDDGYWVQVKNCLSRTELEAAERALANTTVTPDGDTTRTMIKPDTTAYRNEMMASSIVAWNLDEEDGTIWALSPEPVKRANIGRLPGPVFDAVWKTVDRLNSPASSGERKSFRHRPVVGDSDGYAGPGDVVDVPDRTAALAASGVAPGGPGGTPVA